MLSGPVVVVVLLVLRRCDGRVPGRRSALFICECAQSASCNHCCWVMSPDHCRFFTNTWLGTGRDRAPCGQLNWWHTAKFYQRLPVGQSLHQTELVGDSWHGQLAQKSVSAWGEPQSQPIFWSESGRYRVAWTVYRPSWYVCLPFKVLRSVGFSRFDESSSCAVKWGIPSFSRHTNICWTSLLACFPRLLKLSRHCERCVTFPEQKFHIWLSCSRRFFTSLERDYV